MVGRIDDAAAEVVGPDAVDDGPGEERIVRPAQPGHDQGSAIAAVGGRWQCSSVSPSSRNCLRRLRAQRAGHGGEAVLAGVEERGARVLHLGRKVACAVG